ncbi:MAG: hypothetical protein R3F20_00795 [Planctomycetota bacterium]
MRSIVTLGAILALTAAAAAQNNPSFENGLTGWTATPAAAVSVSSAAQLLFPSEGAQYAQISAYQSNAAVAGHGPHSGGTGFGQVSKLSQIFTRPAGSNCIVGIDWTFIMRENELDGANNDFLSIDIIDLNTGNLVKNVVFCDNGSSAGFPSYNGVPGADGGELALVRSVNVGGIVVIGTNTIRLEPAPSGFKRAQCDISSLTASGQLLRLDISVGNGGDDENDSVALVDNFTVRTGGANTQAASFRVLGDLTLGGYQNGSRAEGDLVDLAPYEMKLSPGQNATLAFASDPGPTPFALLYGTFKRDATQTAIGELNLVQSDPIGVAFDGISPSGPTDILLGTIGAGPKFLDITVPEVVLDGSFAMQAVMLDPSNPPINLRLSAATRIVIDDGLRIPLGTMDVLDSGGSTLSDDDFGVIDLTGLNGGSGFQFYGQYYTECYVNSNGNITFGSGDTDFSPSVTELFFDQPRIAPYWDDFNPTVDNGAIRWRTNAVGGIFPTDPRSVTISWEHVSGFSQSANGNSFSVVLYQDGTIEFHYDSLNESNGLVGLSRGNFATIPSTVGPSDLSGGGFLRGNDVLSSSVYPIFEEFSFGQDLLTLGMNGRATIVFEPTFAPNPEFPIFLEFAGYRTFAGNGSN